MSFNRIKAVLLQEFFITLRSTEVIFEVFVFSLVSLFLFGFISLYLAGSRGNTVAHFLLIGMLLWEVARITQYSVSVGSLWNVWSRNLTSMFISPLQVSELIIAHILSGIIKTLFVFIINATVTLFVFHFNIFQFGFLAIFLFFINLIVFSSAIGIFILALIFKYGTRIQGFAWGMVPVLQPLTAAFFPVGVLPHPLREFAYMLPSTYIFEAARYTLLHQSINWQLIGIAIFLNIIYIFLSVFFFKVMFIQSKDSGQFARNEG